MYQPYSPVLTEAILRVPSPPSSVSGSSTETASVSTVGPQQPHQVVAPPEAVERPRLSIHAPHAKAVAPPHMPSPIPELEEEEEDTLAPQLVGSP